MIYRVGAWVQDVVLVYGVNKSGLLCDSPTYMAVIGHQQPFYRL